MRATMLNPKVEDVSTMPLGILYVGSTLEQAGHTVNAFDPLPTVADEKVIRKIVRWEPDVVAISCTTAQMGRGLAFSRLIKEMNPNVQTVFGGYHVTAHTLEVLRDDSVDFAIRNEGEWTMRELCEELEKKQPDLAKIDGLAYKEDGRMKVNKPRELIKNLDEIPHPARHLLPVEWYLRPPGKIRGYWLERSCTMMASRGCPYFCTFCGSNAVFGRVPRYRSAENVIEEIKLLQEKWKVDGVWFADDEFTINEKWCKDFSDKLAAEKLDFVWSCQARVNHGDMELLKSMKKSGCVQIDYGVESGSQRILNALRKGTTPKMIREKFAMTREAGIRTGASHLIGGPGETWDDLKLTYEQVKAIRPNFADFYFLTPLPGSEFYDQAVHNDWIPKTPYSDKWLFTRVVDSPTISLNMSPEELVKARSWLNNMQMRRNYKSYISSPKFMVGITKILARGLPGLPKGLKRYYKTRKLEIIVYAMLEHNRLNSYPVNFDDEGEGHPMQVPVQEGTKYAKDNLLRTGFR
ncbi:MAG: radical SAM protein [Candidatus Aenigmarchaeota archaeon]|nr:radical SAM protein [Candidatus Aenigmarchaeota archaeon]